MMKACAFDIIAFIMPDAPGNQSRKTFRHRAEFRIEPAPGSGYSDVRMMVIAGLALPDFSRRAARSFAIVGGTDANEHRLERFTEQLESDINLPPTGAAGTSVAAVSEQRYQVLFMSNRGDIGRASVTPEPGKAGSTWERRVSARMEGP
jgi:hypothetical protein